MTKILFLDHPQHDAGSFNLWTGLCEVLGPENVVVFPYKKMYYGKVDHHNEGYISFLRDLYVDNVDNVNNNNNNNINKTNRKLMLPYGIPPFQPGEDIINGYPETYDAPYYVTYPDQPPYGEDDIINMINVGQFEFMILSSGHRANTIALARLRDRFGDGSGSVNSVNIGMSRLPPLVYLDSGERDEVNQHWIHVFHPRLIFKSVLTPAVYDEMKMRYGWNIHSLPHSSFLIGKNLRTAFIEFSLRGKTKEEKERIRDEIRKDKERIKNEIRNDVESGKENKEKDILDDVTFDDSGNKKEFDIFYAMGPTYDKRAELIKTIDDFLEKDGKKYIGMKKHVIGYYGFLDMIAKSKIAVTMRGSGRDTTRYWDIPLFKTLMLCDGTMGCIHPYPFEDGKTAVFYDENKLGEIPEILRYYLENDKERERITKAGYEHVRKYHTNKARAEQFLDVIRRELGIAI